MCPLPLEADRPPASPVSRVIGCERVDVGARSALVRVTVALGDVAPARAAEAQLVLVIDGARERRQRALPSGADPQPDTQAAVLTLGFAVTRRAEIVALELDGRRLALPAPTVRPSGVVEPATPPVAAAGGTDPDALAQQLRTTRARLEEARAAAAMLEAERDGARQAAARAEAAAHDATARADALVAPAPGASGVVGRHLRRHPRRAAAAVCAVGSAVLVCGILVWPAGDGAGNRGVTGVASASPASPAGPAADGGVRVPAMFAALAQRLRIPADYLALYRQAGARYGLDWTRLAAIGAIESRHGQSAEAGVASGTNHRGASGPAQFLAGTWERFGVDGDGDGTRDPHAPADAIAAMASYLRASGAPQDWRGALRTYNHSDAYTTAVERLAASYRGMAG